MGNKQPIELAKTVEKSKESKIRLTACNSNRASVMGNACDRRLVYERTRWKDKKPTEVSLQNIFDIGNYLEQHYLREIEDAGFKLINQQADLSIPEVEITGHIDAAIVHEGEKYPLDIKTMSPHVWQTIKDCDSFLNHKHSYVRAYPTQVLLYAHMMKSKWAILYCVNKVTGQSIDVWFDVSKYGDVIQIAVERARLTNEHIKNNNLPDRVKDLSVCGMCPFERICVPDKEFGSGARFVDDAEVNALLREWFETREDSTRHQELDEKIKKWATAYGSDGPIFVGSLYEVRVKSVTRKTTIIPEAVKATYGVPQVSTFPSVKIVRLDTDEEDENAD